MRLDKEPPLFIPAPPRLHTCAGRSAPRLSTRPEATTLSPHPRKASGGSVPWALAMGAGAEPPGTTSGRLGRMPPPPPAEGPAEPRRGLRHVPRPAGAAATALVRGCRGRRSTLPASFIRILGRGRRPTASPGPSGPA